MNIRRTLHNLADRETIPTLLDILIFWHPLRLKWDSLKLVIKMAGLDDSQIRIATTQLNYRITLAEHGEHQGARNDHNQ